MLRDKRITQVRFHHLKTGPNTEQFALGDKSRRIYLSKRSIHSARPWRVWVTGGCDVTWNFGTRQAAMERVQQLLGEELVARWGIKGDKR